MVRDGYLNMRYAFRTYCAYPAQICAKTEKSAMFLEKWLEVYVHGLCMPAFRNTTFLMSQNQTLLKSSDK
jgi:hypothetical protein